jgi:hypothetical protein
MIRLAPHGLWGRGGVALLASLIPSLITLVAPALADEAGPAAAQDIQQQLVEALERLRQVETSSSRLSADLEAERTFKEQLVTQLQQREADLEAVEAVISVLQQEARPDAAPAKAAAMDAAPPEAQDLTAQTTPAGDEWHPVKVFQVNQELEFLVLSNPPVAGVEEGRPFVLAAADHLPLATIQFVEQDRVGFAVAAVLARADGSPAIQKGQECFVRRAASP